MMRGALVALGLVACAASPPRPSPRDAALVLDCAMPTARVYVDETLVGWARELRGKRLYFASGAHRVEIRAPDHFTAYLDVNLVHAGVATKIVTLRPVPPGDPGE